MCPSNSSENPRRDGRDEFRHPFPIASPIGVFYCLRNPLRFAIWTRKSRNGTPFFDSRQKEEYK
jgi:hypothetical protein